MSGETKPPPKGPKSAALLALSAGIVVAAIGALAFGLARLTLGRDHAPAVMAVEKAVLVEALQDAPWTPSDSGQRILWIITAPDCEPCRKFERDALPGLIDSGARVRVIVAPPLGDAPLSPASANLIADFAQKRDWVTLNTWLSGGPAPNAGLEPAAVEGHVEWARASFARIEAAAARNDLKIALPALFWQNGPEWRASVQPDSSALQAIERDLTS